MDLKGTVVTVGREYYITEDVSWFSEKKKWKGLRSFRMVHKVLIKPVLHMQYKWGCR